MYTVDHLPPISIAVLNIGLLVGIPVTTIRNSPLDVKVFCITNSYSIVLNIHVAPCTEGNIELYGGPSSRHGNIRVCINGSWVKVCGYGQTVLDNSLASVVCSSLGYSSYGW